MEMELPIKTHKNNYSYISTPSFERKRIKKKSFDGLKILFAMINLFFKKINEKKFFIGVLLSIIKLQLLVQFITQL